MYKFLLSMPFVLLICTFYIMSDDGLGTGVLDAEFDKTPITVEGAVTNKILTDEELEIAKTISRRTQEEINKYFNIGEESDYTINVFDEGVMRSHHLWTYEIKNHTNGSSEINIGVEDLDLTGSYGSAVYKMVSDHEYMHRVLHKLGVMDTNIHEALADTYTWWANERINKRIWGEENQRRRYPYTIVMNDIFEQDNFECLDKVFVEEDKIDSAREYVIRLNKFCNATSIVPIEEE